MSVELKKDKRYFMVVPFIFHTALREFSFQHFFNLSRQEGIAYDFKTKTGSTFILVDDFKRQVLGIMAIGSSHNECARQMQRNLEFLNRYEMRDSKMFNGVSSDRHDSQSF